MLPKSERFTKKDFIGSRPKVFFRGELLDIAVISFSKQKFACVISKKTLKRAIDRNLVKRRIFSIVKDLPVYHTYSFVFYPKKTSLLATYSQLLREIKTAFDTLH